MATESIYFTRNLTRIIDDLAKQRSFEREDTSFSAMVNILVREAIAQRGIPQGEPEEAEKV